MTGISLLGASGFNISMQYPKNEIFIGISFAVMGGAGLACLPLMNELIVETTYPAGEATSIGIPVWLTSPLSGALVALSSVIRYNLYHTVTQASIPTACAERVKHRIFLGFCQLLTV